MADRVCTCRVRRTRTKWLQILRGELANRWGEAYGLVALVPRLEAVTASLLAVARRDRELHPLHYRGIIADAARVLAVEA